MIERKSGLMSATTEKWTIFGERLKTELERQEMSLRQFSGKTGITLNTAFRYVHSQRIPRATEILKAAEVLHVTCDYMLGLSDDPHKTRDGWTKTAFCDMPTAQPVAKDINVPVKDCISRQEAIDALTRKMVSIPTAGEKDLMGDVNRIRTEDISAIRRLPTAQPELIRINLNEPIKVKLTDWGKEIYYHQYDRTNQIAGREICKPRFPREDENGYTEFQLWCFIELYGMHMGMTLPNVIEPLEIVYER